MNFAKLSLTVGLALVVAVRVVAGPEPEVLRVRADSWMPFNGDPTSGKPGFVVEFLREIFEPAGIKVDYQVMPWAETLKAAESGDIDGAICANATEAASLLIGHEFVAEPQFSLFVRKDSPWKYQNLRSLQEVNLGVVEGYSYWPSIDAYIKKSSAPAVKVFKGDSPSADALGDLVAGGIDVVVESQLVFYWTAKVTGQKASDFRVAYTETSPPLYVAFTKSRRGEKYAKILDEGLLRLKASGRFEAILDKYGFAKR